MQNRQEDEILQVQKTRDGHFISDEKLYLSRAKHYSRMGLPEQAIHCRELALGVLILVLIKIVIGRQLIRILMRAANR